MVFAIRRRALPEWALLGQYGNGAAKSAGRLEYIWLPTEDGNAIPVGLYRNGKLYAVHSDHLGTPRLITNEDKRPVWQWPYSAFGANAPTGILKATKNAKQAYTNQPVLLKATAPALEYNLRYPGQYYDEESQLSYNYQRSYQAGQGRYTQSDPIGLNGRWSRFGYVGGNALSSIDPEGLNTLAALAQAGRTGWNIGQAINPYVQPAIALIIDGVFCLSVWREKMIFQGKQNILDIKIFAITHLLRQEIIAKINEMKLNGSSNVKINVSNGMIVTGPIEIRMTLIPLVSL